MDGAPNMTSVVLFQRSDVQEDSFSQLNKLQGFLTGDFGSENQCFLAASPMVMGLQSFGQAH